MGKLMDRLLKQLDRSEHKKDAEDCIELYNYLKSISNGHVWSSNWTPLADVRWLGKYPYKAHYKPTSMGYTLLEGIRKE